MPEEIGNMGPESAQAAMYAPDGVDLTLIRWMLSLTPAERLEMLEGVVRSLRMLHHEEAGT